MRNSSDAFRVRATITELEALLKEGQGVLPAAERKRLEAELAQAYALLAAARVELSPRPRRALGWILSGIAGPVLFVAGILLLPGGPIFPGKPMPPMGYVYLALGVMVVGSAMTGLVVWKVIQSVQAVVVPTWLGVSILLGILSLFIAYAVTR